MLTVLSHIIQIWVGRKPVHYVNNQHGCRGQILDSNDFIPHLVLGAHMMIVSYFFILDYSFVMLDDVTFFSLRVSADYGCAD